MSGGAGIYSRGGDNLGCFFGISSGTLTPNCLLNLSFRFSHCLGSSLDILVSNKDGPDLSANFDSSSSDFAITC